jgi:phenylalanine-4-hydroxylase
VNLDFESGVCVAGTVLGKTICDGHLILLSLTECSVSYEEKTLFEPSWGTFDMAVGKSIVSVFSGPADPDAFELSYPVPEEKTHKISHGESTKKLHALYQQVRDIREQNCSFALLPSLWQELKSDHPKDWLCALEILELLKEKHIEDHFTREVTQFLLSKKSEGATMSKLIDDGVALFT